MNDEWKAAHSFQIEMEKAAQYGIVYVPRTGEVVRLKTPEATELRGEGIGKNEPWVERRYWAVAALVIIALILWVERGQIRDAYLSMWKDSEALSVHEPEPMAPPGCAGAGLSSIDGSHIADGSIAPQKLSRSAYKPKRDYGGVVINEFYAGQALSADDMNENFRAIAEALNQIAATQRMQYHQEVMDGGNRVMVGIGDMAYYPEGRE